MHCNIKYVQIDKKNLIINGVIYDEQLNEMSVYICTDKNIKGKINIFLNTFYIRFRNILYGMVSIKILLFIGFRLYMVYEKVVYLPH